MKTSARIIPHNALTPQEHLLTGGISPASGIKDGQWHTPMGILSGETDLATIIAQREELGHVNVGPIILLALGVREPLVFSLPEIDGATLETKQDLKIGLWDEERKEVRSIVDGRNLMEEIVGKLREQGVDLHTREQPGIKEAERSGGEKR